MKQEGGAEGESGKSWLTVFWHCLLQNQMFLQAEHIDFAFRSQSAQSGVVSSREGGMVSSF